MHATHPVNVRTSMAAEWLMRGQRGEIPEKTRTIDVHRVLINGSSWTLLSQTCKCGGKARLCMDLDVFTSLTLVNS